MKLPHHWSNYFHQWHSGEDAIYAIGSQVAADRPIQTDSVPGVLELLQESRLHWAANYPDSTAELKQLDWLIQVCQDLLAGDYSRIMLWDLATIALVQTISQEIRDLPESEDCLLTEGELDKIQQDFQMFGKLIKGIPDWLIVHDIDVEGNLPIAFTQKRIDAASRRLGEPLLDVYGRDREEASELFNSQLDYDSADYWDSWSLVQAMQQAVVERRKWRK